MLVGIAGEDLAVGQYGGNVPPETSAAASGSPQSKGFGKFSPGSVLGLSRIIWFTIMRCRFMAERIWVKKSAVSVHSTSTLSDGSNGCCGLLIVCILMMGGVPCRMFISIGNAIETWAPFL